MFPYSTFCEMNRLNSAKRYLKKYMLQGAFNVKSKVLRDNFSTVVQEMVYDVHVTCALRCSKRGLTRNKINGVHLSE